MTTIILAAGYGTRLYPLTLNKPKALLKVGNRTILDRLLGEIARIEKAGKVYIVTNEKFYKSFEDWKEKSTYPLKIEVINDGTKSNETRLGAIGDIGLVMNEKQVKGDVLITGSDNLFEFDLKDFADFGLAKKPFSSIALFDVKDKVLAKNYGICSLDKEGRVIDFAEKPASPASTLAATALYFIPGEKTSKVQLYMKSGLPKDAPGNLMKWLAETDKLFGYVTKDKWYDIGDKESLEKADLDFTKKGKEK